MGRGHDALDVRSEPKSDSHRDFAAEPEVRRSNDGYEQLLAAAQAGSLSAIGSVLEDCRNYLLLIANRELGDSIQAKIGASDLVQETFCQAHQIFDRFDGSSRPELAAWLARILDFKLAQTKRQFVVAEKRKVTRERPLHFATDTVVRDARRGDGLQRSQSTDSAEELDAFQRVLAELPEDYRVAIELRSIQQQSFADLGRALGRSPDAARMTWARAVLRLRKELRVRRMQTANKPSSENGNR